MGVVRDAGDGAAGRPRRDGPERGSALPSQTSTGRGVDRAAAAMLVTGAAVTLVLLESLRATFTRLHYLNISAFEIHPSAGLLLLFAAPALLALAPRSVTSAPALPIAAAVTGLAHVAAVTTHATGRNMIAPVAAVAASLALLAVLVGAARRTAPRGMGGNPVVAVGLVGGIATGVALDAILTVLGSSNDPSQGNVPLALLTALVLVIGASFRMPATGREATDAHPRSGSLRAAVAGAALGAWGFLAHAAFGNPHVLATSDPDRVGLVAVSVVGGFALGAVLVLFLQQDGRGLDDARARAVRTLDGARGPVVAGAVLVTGASIHAWFPSVPMFVVAALTATAMVPLVHWIVGGLAACGIRTAAMAWGVAGLVLAGAHLAYAATFDFGAVGPVTFNGRALFPGGALLVTAGSLVSLVPGRPAHVAHGTGSSSVVSRLIVGTGVVIVAGIVILVAPVTADPPVPPPGDPLIVVTLNTHQGFTNAGVLDPDAFVALINTLDADIIALQETPTPVFTTGHLDLGRYIADRLPYHAVGRGLTLLSRAPVDSWREVPIGGEGRIALEALVDVNGQPVHVLVTHLSHGNRIREGFDLARHVGTLPGPVIVAGDFNTCPGRACPWQSSYLDVYGAMTATLDDAWMMAGHAIDDPMGNTISALRPRARIDYVFVSPDIGVDGAEVIRSAAARAASDHLPLRVALVLPAGPAAQPSGP